MLKLGLKAPNIIDQAREIVNRNGFLDVITLIKGKVEEINFPALVEKSRGGAKKRPATDDSGAQCAVGIRGRQEYVEPTSSKRVGC